MATSKLGDYTFVEPIPDKFKCWECKKLLEEPHVTECCGQHFCQKCIEKSSQRTQQQYYTHTQVPTWLGGVIKDLEHQARKPLCPNCKTMKFKHIRYLPLKRKINDLIVYCPHKSKGCKEQVKLENIEAHTSNCNYQPIWCTNKCGQALLKGRLNDHLTNSCPQRLKVCKYCQDIYRYVQEYDHQLKCPDFPLPCSNGCGRTEIKRKDVNGHKQVCPLENIKCTFAEVGCTYHCQRKNLPEHMKENVESHLSLMMEAHLKLKQELQRRSYIS